MSFEEVRLLRRLEMDSCMYFCKNISSFFPAKSNYLRNGYLDNTKQYKILKLENISLKMVYALEKIIIITKLR